VNSKTASAFGTSTSASVVMRISLGRWPFTSCSFSESVLGV
jgi:hypothetical protein